MHLPDFIADDLHAKRIITQFADRATVNFWNQNRGEGEPVSFCGWYWYGNINRQMREGGPFRSESAAMRDAWYHAVQGTAPPLLYGANEVREMVRARLQFIGEARAQGRTTTQAWREAHAR